MRDMDRLLFELHAKLPAYQRRIDWSRQTVEDALQEMQNGYIGMSGGKDSLVTAHLVWSVNPDVPAVYFDADCAFPETLELLAYYAKEHNIIKWKTESLLDTFERCGGPTADGIGNATMESTVYTPIRSLLTEYGFDGVFLGLRSEESDGRAKTAKYHGSLYRYKRDGVLRCLPVINLCYRDVWSYIIEYKLKYNAVYDKMWDMPEEDRRVSYWAGETKVRWGRWVFLKQAYPELWNKFAERFPEVRAFC